ncbi:MAG: caspase family protein [Treponema sp.]|nr:caspase family protein [Treponema sp.]
MFFPLFLPSLPAQDLGASLTISGSGGIPVASFGDAQALVIGKSEYTGSWPRLSGVKSDVQAVRRLFEEQGFAVETIENAPGRTPQEDIESFLNRYGYDPDTRIVVYYAGHGETLQLGGGNEMGYIVPVDAPLPSGDRAGYVSGTELGMFLQTTVVNYSNATQHPQYGKIRNPSLDKGDFVFVPARSRVRPAAPSSRTPDAEWTPAGDFELDLGEFTTITKYKGTVAVVNIPARVDDIPVGAVGNYAFHSTLTSITIPSSVTSIGGSPHFAGATTFPPGTGRP